MADGSVSGKVNAGFTNVASAGSVTPCCKDVKGRWKEIPKIYPNGMPDLLGDPQVNPTYYFNTIPKGFSLSARMRHKFHINGRLECYCATDGRILSDTPFDKDVQIEAQTFLWSENVLKKFIGGPLSWALTIADLLRLGKKVYDAYNQNPELIKELAKEAGPAAEKALQEAKDSADNLCKNKHKCTEPTPPKPDDGPLVS